MSNELQNKVILLAINGYSLNKDKSLDFPLVKKLHLIEKFNELSMLSLNV